MSETRRPAGREAFAPLRLLAGYGLIGVLNSAVGWSVIFACDLSHLMAPALANAAGFAAGVALGAVLHRRLFDGDRTRAQGLRYVVAVGLSFALNQAVLALALRALGGSPLSHAAAQGGAIVSYSVALFGLCRLWVFARPPLTPRRATPAARA